jgi:type II secretory pathway pseudopilin PulG
MKIRWHTIQKGETLLEALVALAIISVVITAVASVVTASLSNAQYNENQTQATKYAQEGLESVRKIRNQNYVAFRNINGLFCFGKGQTSLGSVQTACSTENVDTFIRTIQIEQTPGCAPNVARVTVSVSFRDGKCQNNTYCHAQTHSSCLSTVNPYGSL